MSATFPTLTAAIQSALNGANALAAAAQPPAPPPPAPTPSGGPFVVALPSAHFHQQPGQKIKFDLIPASALAGRAVPFDQRLLADPVKGVFAFSKQGARPTTIYSLPVFGNPTSLYSQVPYFNKKGLSDPYSPEIGDDFDQIVNDLNARPLPLGERGIALPGVYATFISHPYEFPVGHPQAGQPIPRAPWGMFFWHNAQVGLAFANPMRIDDAGFIPNIKHLHHICVDPTNRKIMYACDLGSKDAAGKWSGGCIWRVDRTPGSGTNVKEDASKYAVTPFLTGLSYPTAVRCDDAGNLFIADSGTEKILRRDAATGALTTFCSTLPGVFAMDIFNGYLYVATRLGEVHKVSLADGTVGPNLMPTQYLAAAAIGVDFFTVSIDRNGTFGPVGEFSVARVHTQGNTNLWEFSADGMTVKYGQGIYTPSMQGWDTVGTLATNHEPYGHYDWFGAQYHEFQAIRIVGGYANVPIGLLAADPGTIPALGASDYTLVWRGMRVMAENSLTSMCSREGWSPFPGCSFDEMANLTFDQLEDWIHKGWISLTRRDNIVGMDLLALMTLICVNSQRHLLEGKPFIDKLVSWYQTKHVPTYGAIVTPADVVKSALVAEQANYLEAREVTPGQYRIGVFGEGGSTPERYTSIHENTNAKDASGNLLYPIPAGAVIVANEGIVVNGVSIERVLTNGDGSALPSGQHALTIRVPAGATGVTSCRAIAVLKP
jgi:hypothetical protein